MEADSADVADVADEAWLAGRLDLETKTSSLNLT
jgi:hypothetical protein